MPRTEKQTAAAADLAEVLTALGAGIRATPRAGTVDLTLPSGDALALDVVALAAPRAPDVQRLAARPRSSTVPVLVADRLVPRVREELSAAGWGWLDRRGHVRLVAGTVVVDTDIPPLLDDSRPGARAVLDTSVGLAVATATLTDATRPKSVRQLVAFTGHSLGAVHAALRGLKDAQLVDADALPLVPELFWEIAGRWRPDRVPLAAPPDEPADGWTLCDTVAAARFGAPLVVRGDYPVDLYVPDDRTVRLCRRVFGTATSPEVRRASVAVAPFWWVYARPERVEGEDWNVVHPVIAALDLSVDRGRGREALDAWDPPAPYRRVW